MKTRDGVDHGRLLDRLLGSREAGDGERAAIRQREREWDRLAFAIGMEQERSDMEAARIRSVTPRLWSDGIGELAKAFIEQKEEQRRKAALEYKAGLKARGLRIRMYKKVWVGPLHLLTVDDKKFIAEYEAELTIIAKYGG